MKQTEAYKGWLHYIHYIFPVFQRTHAAGLKTFQWKSTAWTLFMIHLLERKISFLFSPCEGWAGKSQVSAWRAKLWGSNMAESDQPSSHQRGWNIFSPPDSVGSSLAVGAVPVVGCLLPTQVSGTPDVQVETLWPAQVGLGSWPSRA